MKLQLGKPDVVANPLEDFISALTVAGASENTVKLYKAAISDFLNFVGKDPRQVTTADVNKWLSEVMKRETRTTAAMPEYEKKRQKSSTAKLYAIAVTRFLHWIGVDIKPTMPKARKREIKALSDEEVEKLLSVAKGKYKLIISLLLDTGLRTKELLSLRKEDIDLQRRMIIVRNTKNGEERVVFFTEETAKLLEKHLKKLNNNDRVFDVSYFALYRKLKRLGKKLGIDMRPHVLRHTFATRAIRKGMPLPVVQRLLGHKDIRTTQIYTHLVTEDLKRVYDSTFSRVG